MINGLFPPNSPVNGMIFSAADLPIWRAASGEPVNEIRFTFGSDTSAAPTSSPIPWTILKTPAGKPASSIKSPNNDADNGDHSAGFKITLFPAARAGAHFHVDNINGAFHGVIMTLIPLGIR